MMKRYHLLQWLGAVLALQGTLSVQAADLPAVAVKAAADQAATPYEGSVEAVRQTTLAAQVPGAVTDLNVRAGQSVQAGQVLLRLDARAADQASAASRAQLEVAASDLQRKRLLFARQYISKAAMEQAEAAYKAAAAQATAAQTQSGFHVVKAPYAGVVSAVSVELGDMAMPGRPLLTLYDPAALRVTASVPSSVLGQANTAQVKVELPDAARPAQGDGMVTPMRVEVLPTVDPRSLTQQVRASLPGGAGRAVPGMFARLWLSAPGAQAQAGAGSALAGTAGAMPNANGVRVPLKAVVRRAEMTGLYVLDGNGKPLLRQVRLGLVSGDMVEILSGLQSGERVVTDPQAAARAQ